MSLAHYRPLALLAVGGVVACHDGTAPATRDEPRELRAVGNLSQLAVRGDDALTPLRVLVIGTDGKPFAGAQVAWTTQQGAAVLDPPASATDAAGEATTHVNELSATGAINITASVGKVPPVTFTINVSDPCLTNSAHPTKADSVVTGVLRAIDCALGDQYFDFYGFVLPAQRAVIVRATSPSFDPWVQAFNLTTGNSLGGVTAVAQSGIIEMRIILPAGINGMGVTSTQPRQTGGYTITAEVTDEEVTGCQRILVAHNVTTQQHLEAADCEEVSGERYYDTFMIFLWEGQRVALTESSTAFTPRLRLRAVGGTIVGDVSGDVAAPARIDFTSPATAYYQIVTSSVTKQTGSYTLAVAETPASSPAMATQRGAAAIHQWHPAPNSEH